MVRLLLLGPVLAFGWRKKCQQSRIGIAREFANRTAVFLMRLLGLRHAPPPPALDGKRQWQQGLEPASARGNTLCQLVAYATTAGPGFYSEWIDVTLTKDSVKKAKAKPKL